MTGHQIDILIFAGMWLGVAGILGLLWVAGHCALTAIRGWLR